MAVVTDEPRSADPDGAPSPDERRDRVRSGVECAMVIALALAIPAALLVAAWRMAPGGYGKGVVKMAGVTMLIVAVGAGVAAVSRAGASGAARRRALASGGRCARCGYDLAGLRAGTCPECGGPTPPAPDPRDHT